MAPLVFGIHVAFSLFFFVFARMTEAIVFAFLAVASVVYFSRVIHTLQHGKSEEKTVKSEKIPTGRSVSFSQVAAMIKKWSFYIGFCFLYISLYGISYGVNSLYGDLAPFSLFKIIILVFSLVVGGVYIRYFREKNPFISLVFRSNFLVTSFFSFVLLWGLFLSGTIPEIGWLLFINSVLSFVGIFFVLVFDRDFSYPQELFSFWLVYAFSIVFIYVCTTFGSFRPWEVLFFLLSIASIGYFEGIVRIRMLRNYILRSKQIGVLLGYVSLVGLTAYVLLVPSVFLWGVLLVSVAFQYAIHYRYRNYLSYLLVLIVTTIAYTYWLIPSAESLFFFHLLFAFALPIGAIALTVFVRMRHESDANVLHYIAIAFCAIACGRYVFLTIHSFDILRGSVLLLFLSGLLFSSYIVLKK